MGNNEPKKTIWVSRVPGVSDEDIKAAEVDYINEVEDVFAVLVNVIKKHPAIKLIFKDNARKKLENFTTENTNKMVVTILDGEILFVSKIFVPITEGEMVAEGNLPASDVERIVNRINDIVRTNTKR